MQDSGIISLKLDISSYFNPKMSDKRANYQHLHKDMMVAWWADGWTNVKVRHKSRHHMDCYEATTEKISAMYNAPASE